MMLDIRGKLQLAKIPDDAKPSLELMKTMFVSILEVCLVELDNQREPDCGITEKQTGIGAEANDLVGSPGLLKGMYYESVCFARDY